MKKLVKLLFMLTAMTILFSIGVPARAAELASSKSYTISVTYKSAQLTYNNHVGNNWVKAVTVNGKNVNLNSNVKLTLKSTDTLAVKFTATEKDTSPDIGTSAINLSIGSIKTGVSTYSQNVIVTENKGRYKGNKACWKFTITVKKS
jgi:hypothetical protein